MIKYILRLSQYIKKIPNLIRPFIISWPVQYLVFEALFNYLRIKSHEHI